MSNNRVHLTTLILFLQIHQRCRYSCWSSHGSWLLCLFLYLRERWSWSRKLMSLLSAEQQGRGGKGKQSKERGIQMSYLSLDIVRKWWEKFIRMWNNLFFACFRMYLMELHLSQQLALTGESSSRSGDWLKKKILHSPHLSTFFFSKWLHSHTQREGSKVSAHRWRREGTTSNRQKGEQRGEVESRELARLSCTETPPGARISFYPSVFVSMFNLCPGNLPLLRLQVRAAAPQMEGARLCNIIYMSIAFIRNFVLTWRIRFPLTQQNQWKPFFF